MNFLETAENTTSSVMNFKDILNIVIEWCVTDGVKIVLGLIALFILFKITNFLTKKIRKNLTKRNADKTIIQVASSVFSKGLKLLWLLLFLSFIGIETASIGTVVASLSVCFGLALQGSLSNLAGGLVILIMRPFRIGDFITAQGEAGTVEEIGIFYSRIVTGDNKVVMIPNGSLANGVIVNNSLKDTRRVDLKFGIAYEADYKKSVEVIKKAISNYDQVLKDKDVFVKMSAHLDSAVEITTRVWVKSPDYWTVYFGLLEDVKRMFDEEGIEIPYNKLDVNLNNK